MRQIDIRQIRVGNPERTGVSICAEGVNFTITAAEDQKVSLLLFDKKRDDVQDIPFPDNCRIGDVASLFIEKLNYKKYEYAYCINDEIVPDPYAVFIKDGRCGFEHERMLASEGEVEWIPFEEMILYKLHVKGFSKMAGKSIKKKGTFRGVEEAIPYFKELGINAIEFMPMYEWSEDLYAKKDSVYSLESHKEQVLKNYWGYGLVNYYFAPKALYAATKDPVRECRQMIQKLHEAGIECIMEFYFPKNIEPMQAINALIYWKLYYGVDGFHLIGDGVPVEAIIRSPFFVKTKLFFDRVEEEWIDGKENKFRRHIAEYNNDFMSCGRRFLKSDGGQIWDFMYQIRKNPEKYGVVNYMANNNGFTLNDVVSYNCKHNEENKEDNRDGMPADDVWNCGEEGPTDKAHINAFRLKQMKNAMLYTLLSQGTPLIYQGDEFGNSQNGNNNAYAMDNEAGWVDWKRSSWAKEYHKFVKAAIAFRKTHPVLHQEKPLRMADYREYGYPDISYHNDAAWYPQLSEESRSIACMYCGAYAKDADGVSDEYIYAAYNAYWKAQEFALPKLPSGMSWQVALQTEVPEKTGYEQGEVLQNQKILTVTSRTVLILIGKQE